MNGYTDLYDERLVVQNDRTDALKVLDFRPSRQPTAVKGRRIYPRETGKFSFPAKTSRWTERYHQLVEFQKQEGHCSVPTAMRALSRWVAEQRKHPEKLRSDQIEQLLDIEFPFQKDDQSWFTFWRALKDYRKKESTTYILPQKKSEFPQLATWSEWQRSKKNREWMKPHQRFLLNEIGFEWNGLEARWKWMYAKARRYYEEHGHWGIKPEPLLQQWCNNQRDALIKAKLSARHKALLDAIHFAWIPVKLVRKENDTFISALREFHKEHGHANIPATWPDQKLVRWLARQRGIYLRNRLNPQIVVPLTEMGVVWDRSEKMWSHRIALLREFYQQTGHWQMPDHHKSARFMRAVRKAYANGKLHPHHRRELEQLGFENARILTTPRFARNTFTNGVSCEVYRGLRAIYMPVTACG